MTAAQRPDVAALDIRAAGGTDDAYRMRSATTTRVGELLSEDEVAERTGLAGPLVVALIPAAATAGANVAAHDRPPAKLYDQQGVLRAEMATLLLDMGVSQYWVRASVRDSRTCDQLRAAIETLRGMCEQSPAGRLRPVGFESSL